MNETERAQNPVAEAVRGYMRDRTLLIKQLGTISESWTGREKFIAEIHQRIEDIDVMVERLCASRDATGRLYE